MFYCLFKSVIYIILKFTILHQNWYIQKDVSGSLKISNCDWSVDYIMLHLFEGIVHSNKYSMY